jgi:tetratricopeptide (TPR) repeat protein
VKKFIRELRRREVFRTAGLYVGICWILIEVANVVLPTFDAPDWSLRAVILTAVIGFPVMLVLAWVYDVTERGILTQAEPTDTIVAPLGTRKMDFVVIGILSVALMISVYLNVTRGPGTDEVPELVSILIADFDNQTGDAVFDGSLEQALQIGLESAPFVNTYQRSAALGVLSQIQPDATRLSEESARLIAVREGIDIVLAGTIKPDGSGYKIEVRVFDGATGEETTDEDDKANSKLEVLEVVGGISGDLRKDLGDASVGYGTEGSVETFTAASIEAARDYTLAQELARAGKPDEALGYYASAVEKDPNFGRALSGWALTLFELGRTDEANALWERAIAQQGMMTERERLRTLGLYYMAVSKNYEKAIESYESLVTNFPADGAGHNNLAVAYFSTLNFERAMQEGLRVLEIYPTRTFYMQNFSLYAMYAGEFDLAEARGREVIEKDPSRFYAWLPVAIAALSRGDLAGAESAYGSMIATGDRGASLGNLGLADMAIYRGRNPEAIELLRQELLLTRRPEINDRLQRSTLLWPKPMRPWVTRKIQFNRLKLRRTQATG